MQDEAGRLWTSLGQSPGLQMAWRRWPIFRSDTESRSAVRLHLPAQRWLGNAKLSRRFGEVQRFCLARTDLCAYEKLEVLLHTNL